jgi:hypothetical protein
MLNLADLWRLGGTDRPVTEMVSAPDASEAGMPPGLADIGFMDLITDWYRLRNGRHLAFGAIPAERIVAYRQLAERYAARDWQAGSLQYRIAALIRMLIAYTVGEPSGDFSVDLGGGGVTKTHP